MSLDIDRILSARRESKHLEFKEKFDPNQDEDWCKIIKHIVAIANSGGGAIVIGVKDDGTTSSENSLDILKVDPAIIIDKIARYTGCQFDGFEISEGQREGSAVVVMGVAGVSIPMVFIKQGAYLALDGKQKYAFSQGSVYFRHGAKSEPGQSEDLRKLFERELKRVKKSWLGNIRKVVDAPIGSKVQLVTGDVVESDLPSAQPIRWVEDLSAPAYRKVWDESAYQSPQEIVVGVLKSWKRDKSSYASESDIWAIYTSRKGLQLDEEKAECLLQSAIYRHAPFFFFAKLLPHERLITLIRDQIGIGKYPAPNVAVKLAYALGGKVGSQLLDHIADHCGYLRAERTARKLKATASEPNRIRSLYGSSVKIQTRSFDITKLKTVELEKLMDDAVQANDKAAIKHLDALLYGTELGRTKQHN